MLVGLSLPFAVAVGSACNGLIGLREPTELCPRTTITKLSGIVDVLIIPR